MEGDRSDWIEGRSWPGSAVSSIRGTRQLSGDGDKRPSAAIVRDGREWATSSVAGIRPTRKLSRGKPPSPPMEACGERRRDAARGTSGTKGRVVGIARKTKHHGIDVVCDAAGEF